jgi:hypothetical protein
MFYYYKKLKNGRHLSLQMLCRVLAYLNVEAVSQTACKVDLADFVVVVFTDTAIARSYLTRHSSSRMELKGNKQ